MKLMKNFVLFSLFVLFIATGACSSVPGTDGSDGGDGGDGTGSGTDGGTNPPTSNLAQVLFNPVGAVLDFNLIDLEFLPGQNGDLIVAGKDGTLYYLDGNFNLIASANINDHLGGDGDVMDSDERGLQGIAAHPNYASNGMIYIFYTYNSDVADAPVNDVNRVERRTVSITKPGGPLLLGDARMIIEFPKTESNNPGHNHNGGAMVFDSVGNLILGVGDGGGSSSANTTEAISQNGAVSLGKLHRIVPSVAVNNGGFTIPVLPADDPNTDNLIGPDTIYMYGLRNPFTIVNKEKNDQLAGDVGSSVYEEINCIYNADENFGWPLFEGKTGLLQGFEPAAHGYAHDDSTFADADPLAVNTGSRSIMVVAWIEGANAYNGTFERRVIYTDFYQGWVRALRVEPNHLKSADDHIGHLSGLTSLQENPADGFYYGVSLGGSNMIQRMELAP